MSICVTVDETTKNLVSSSAFPCDGYYLLTETDLQSTFEINDVFLLFAAAASVYAISFVIRLALKQLGY